MRDDLGIVHYGKFRKEVSCWFYGVETYIY